MLRLLIPALPLLLLACTDAREECIDAAAHDLGVVQQLIADTEATIERGYAIQTTTRTAIYTNFCIGTGTRNSRFSFCQSAQPATSQTPVAVDLDEERLKLASLRAKEASLKAETSSEIQRCELAHPKPRRESEDDAT